LEAAASDFRSHRLVSTRTAAGRSAQDGDASTICRCLPWTSRVDPSTTRPKVPWTDRSSSSTASGTRVRHGPLCANVCPESVSPRGTSICPVVAEASRPRAGAIARWIATPMASPAHVEGAVRSQLEFNVTARLNEIATPTLVVAGDRDRHIPIRYTLSTAAAIRRAGVQIYHNVGHAPFFEVPDRFTQLLEQF